MTEFSLQEINQKQMALQTLFSQLSPITILAANGADGFGASRVTLDAPWTVRIEMPAWRVEGQALQTSPLVVTKQVSDSEYEALEDAFTALENKVISFTGKLALDNPYGDARAELVSELAEKDDAELSTFLADYNNPVSFEDKQLGHFALNKSIKCFVGKAKWCKQLVHLTLETDNADATQTLQMAHVLWNNMADWNKQINHFAAKELLPIKNETWLDEDENALTEETFISAIVLESIVVYPNGDFSFWFNDGDIFWGHAIAVSGSLDQGLTNASIEG
jgi:hypothetical protein